MDLETKALDLTQRLIEKAKKAGADAADAVVFESISMDASYRMQKLEEVERSESQDLGLRVFVGKQQAVVSSTNFAESEIDPLVERAVAMAKLAPEDPYCGLAPSELLATSFPDLDLLDQFEPSSDELADWAAEAESVALDVEGVTNSNGASGGWGRGGVALATSEGFAGAYSSSSFSVSCSVLAGEGLEMEMGYDYHSVLHREDLEDPKKIGGEAAERALKALNPKRPKSGTVPVVYENRLSQSLIGHFAGAINGSGIARGTSFLKDKMGELIFAESINIVDDPHRKRGQASKPFDGEGVANKKTALIENGILKTWLLDMATAAKLGLQTTGHASRGTGAPPSPGRSNLYLEPGTLSPEDLMADIKEGLFVNNMFGPSINPTTGDYSVGVSGHWIENGEITFPVNEITIAGNLIDMFKALTPANDLQFRFSANAPTIRIDGMTVAGD